MAYTQKHKYGFRDSLQKGDPEKVIYGVYFDDEFEALESELEKVFDALDPDGDAALLHEAPAGADQPWARDGEAEAWVQTVTLTQYTNDISTIEGDINTIEGNINTIEGNINNIIDGSTPIDETDPTVPAHVKAITSTQITNWDASFGWGDHSAQGYLKSFTETDPTVPAHVKGISQADINNWNAAAGNTGPDMTAYYTKTESDNKFQLKGSYLTSSDLSGYATQSWVTSQGYLTSASLNGYATQTWVTSQGYSTYTGADAVKTSGNQTVGGSKTFSSNVTAPDFVATSDIAMKMNVQTAPIGLIDQIRGVEFDWRNSGKSASGVIANEIERVLPHLVSEQDGVKHVSYMGLIAYLIEEIKHLKASK